MNKAEELREMLGLARPAPIAWEGCGQSEEDGYVRERLEAEGDDGAPIPAFAFKPRGRRVAGGVVVYHQHNGEFHLGKSEVAGLEGDPRQAFGPALARRGVTVLAPDAVTFEDRRPGIQGTVASEGDWLQHYNGLAYRLQNGDTLMRKCLADAQRMLSVLLGLAELDAARVGVAGHSFGGTLAMYHAVVDDRCRFACVSGAVCSYAKRQASGTGIGMVEVVPGLAKRFEVRDMIAAIQPRPLLVVSATEDEYSADAEGVLRAAGPSTSTRHLRAKGGHPLDERRFTAIVDWLAGEAGA